MARSVLGQDSLGALRSAARRFSSLALRLDSRPARFLLVGTTGVAVSSSVLWLASRVLGFPTFWGGLVAGATATFTNFLLNDIFTWRDRRSLTLREKGVRMLRYYATTAVGNTISLGVLVALSDGLHLFLLLANLIAIGVGGTFNYLIHSVWTFRRRESL